MDLENQACHTGGFFVVIFFLSGIIMNRGTASWDTPWTHLP